MHTDLIGKPCVTRGGNVTGTITGLVPNEPAFCAVTFSNGWHGEVRADIARAALARGEPIVANVSNASLTTAARSAKASLDAIRRGETVPAKSDTIAAWQKAQPGKDQEAAAILAETNFKSQVLRGVEQQMAPAKGGGQIAIAVKHCGRED